MNSVKTWPSDTPFSTRSISSGEFSMLKPGDWVVRRKSDLNIGGWREFYLNIGGWREKDKFPVRISRMGGDYKTLYLEGYIGSWDTNRFDLVVTPLPIPEDDAALLPDQFSFDF